MALGIGLSLGLLVGWGVSDLPGLLGLVWEQILVVFGVFGELNSWQRLLDLIYQSWHDALFHFLLVFHLHLLSHWFAGMWLRRNTQLLVNGTKETRV